MATIYGTEGDDDSLYGTTGNDHIFGLGGNDQINGDAGSDVIDGGDGNDYISDPSGANILRGGAGDDHLNGGVDGETLYGGTGDDYLYGGGGADTLFGGAGNDKLEVSDGGDRIDGGGGIDNLVISYLDAPGDVRYVFKADAQGVVHARFGATAIHVEQVELTGGNGNDILTGGMMNDTVRGWTGNDVLRGLGGNDFMIGDNGNDTLYGGAGDDYLTGGGNDDVLVGGGGNDILVGGQAFDLYSGHDLLEGGAGADEFHGGNGQTDLSFVHSTAGVYIDLQQGIGFGGEAEGDTYDVNIHGWIFGSAYNDMLVGGQYEDGGAGDDRLVSVGYTLTMTGGDGIDRFVFRYQPNGSTYYTTTITDFDQANHEFIDLSQADAAPALGRQGFHFIGTDAFSGHAGEMRYENTSDGNTTIQFNMDSDTDPEATIILTGTYTLTTADFHF